MNSINNQAISYDIRLLVAVSHTKQSAKLLLSSKKLADQLHASSLQAVYVEGTHDITKKQQKELDHNISIAKSLGIDFRIISNYNTVKGIVAFAVQEQVTHIVIGKPRVYNLLTFVRRGDFVNQLIKQSGTINVYVLGDDDIIASEKYHERVTLPSFTSRWHEYLIASLFVVLATVFCYFLTDFVGYRIISFLFLFLVSVMAFFYGTGPVLLASTLSALIWNFFFIPPHLTFHIDNTEDMMMFFMFFIIALLNGVFTSRVRRQEMRIRKREERTNALYRLTKQLSEVNGLDQVKEVFNRGVEQYFKSTACILLQDDLTPQHKHEEFTQEEWKAVTYCFEKLEKCGRFTDVYGGHVYNYFPLVGAQMTIGVLALKQHERFTFGEEQFFDAYVAQISAKFEREVLRTVAHKAHLLDESDKLYKTLFNSISHEFRIPVTAIMGASDTLLTQHYPIEVQEELFSEINIASIRLNHLIENLLNMSRLESGRLSLRCDWCDVHDLINRVTEMLTQELQPFTFQVLIPEDFPLVRLDFGLMEQVVYNLLFNATQYAPPKSDIRIEFGIDNRNLKIIVSDNGIGFGEEELHLVFDKFYRGKSNRTGGTGLGLSIVKGFVEAHKGHVVAKNNPSGGAEFDIRIPIELSNINDLTLNVKSQ